MEVNGRLKFGDRSSRINFNYTNQIAKDQLQNLDYNTRIRVSRPLIKGFVSDIVLKLFSGYNEFDKKEYTESIINITDSIYELLETKTPNVHLPEEILISVISNELEVWINKIYIRRNSFPDINSVLKEIKVLAESVSNLTKEG